MSKIPIAKQSKTYQNIDNSNKNVALENLAREFKNF